MYVGRLEGLSKKTSNDVSVGCEPMGRAVLRLENEEVEVGDVLRRRCSESSDQVRRDVVWERGQLLPPLGSLLRELEGLSTGLGRLLRVVDESADSDEIDVGLPARDLLVQEAKGC